MVSGMSLDHALLVSLLEKPSSGYELARRFDRSIGYFWHATHQQIYKVLARMEEAGWVDSTLEAGAVAPDRRLFSVSVAGRAELERWLDEPSDPEGIRDSLMVKLRGAAFADPADGRIGDPEVHLRSFRQCVLRALAGKPVLSILLRRDLLPAQASVRPFVDDQVAAADG